MTCGKNQIAKQFDVSFRKAAGRVGRPRHRVDDPIREDKRCHHVMRDAVLQPGFETLAPGLAFSLILGLFPARMSI
jgi:hypothetical protein